MSDFAAALTQRFGQPPAPITDGLNAAVQPFAHTAASDIHQEEQFIDYIQRVRPTFKLYRHVIDAAKILQRVADGELKYVIVQWPPRAGKSEQFSRLFSAYILSRWPHRWVALTSYGADLAEELSGEAQENFIRGGGKVHPRFSALSRWKTLFGGGMWASGVGGPAAGRGFHIGIVDDPVKDDVQASSDVTARRIQNWWRSVWYNRGQSDGLFEPAYIVITTRWPGPADLVSWLLEQEGADDDEPLRWHIVSWEAIKENDELHEKLPATCTREPDPRKPGESICEERLPLRRLNRIRKRIGPYFWASLFQQRPTPQEGGTFKADWLRDIVLPHEVPSGRCPDVRYWDEAASPGHGDWTVGLKLRWGVDGNFYVMHILRGQWGTDERRVKMHDQVEEDGLAVIQVTQQEPARAGKDAALDFIRAFPGYPRYTEPASGRKAVRGRPVEAACAAGLVKIVKGSWNKAFVDELIALIWDVTTDDQGECLASNYNWMVRRPVQQLRQPTVMGIPSYN